MTPQSNKMSAKYFDVFETKRNEFLHTVMEQKIEQHLRKCQQIIEVRLSRNLSKMAAHILAKTKRRESPEQQFLTQSLRDCENMLKVALNDTVQETLDIIETEFTEDTSPMSICAAATNDVAAVTPSPTKKKSLETSLKDLDEAIAQEKQHHSSMLFHVLKETAAQQIRHAQPLFTTTQNEGYAEKVAELFYPKITSTTTNYKTIPDMLQREFFDNQELQDRIKQTFSCRYNVPFWEIEKAIDDSMQNEQMPDRLREDIASYIKNILKSPTQDDRIEIFQTWHDFVQACLGKHPTLQTNKEIATHIQSMVATYEEHHDEGIMLEGGQTEDETNEERLQKALARLHKYNTLDEKARWRPARKEITSMDIRTLQQMETNKGSWFACNNEVIPNDDAKRYYKIIKAIMKLSNSSKNDAPWQVKYDRINNNMIEEDTTRLTLQELIDYKALTPRAKYDPRFQINKWITLQKYDDTPEEQLRDITAKFISKQNRSTYLIYDGDNNTFCVNSTFLRMSDNFENKWRHLTHKLMFKKWGTKLKILPGNSVPTQQRTMEEYYDTNMPLPHTPDDAWTDELCLVYAWANAISLHPDPTVNKKAIEIRKLGESLRTKAGSNMIGEFNRTIEKTLQAKIQKPRGYKNWDPFNTDDKEKFHFFVAQLNHDKPNHCVAFLLRSDNSYILDSAYPYALRLNQHTFEDVCGYWKKPPAKMFENVWGLLLTPSSDRYKCSRKRKNSDDAATYVLPSASPPKRAFQL